jgi:hypothetical protein
MAVAELGAATSRLEAVAPLVKNRVAYQPEVLKPMFS